FPCQAYRYGSFLALSVIRVFADDGPGLVWLFYEPLNCQEVMILPLSQCKLYLMLSQEKLFDLRISVHRIEHVFHDSLLQVSSSLLRELLTFLALQEGRQTLIGLSKRRGVEQCAHLAEFRVELVCR